MRLPNWSCGAVGDTMPETPEARRTAGVLRRKENDPMCISDTLTSPATGIAGSNVEISPKVLYY